MSGNMSRLRRRTLDVLTDTSLDNGHMMSKRRRSSVSTAKPPVRLGRAMKSRSSSLSVDEEAACSSKQQPIGKRNRVVQIRVDDMLLMDSDHSGLDETMTDGDEGDEDEEEDVVSKKEDTSSLLDSDLRNDIRTRYDKLYAEYREVVHSKAENLFELCLAARKKSLAYSDQIKKEPLVLEETDASRADKFVTREFDPNLILQAKAVNRRRQKVIILPDADPLPPMTYWKPAQCNFYESDSLELSHIPYMDEVVPDAFCEELIETYEEGIHGVKTGYNSFINDELLHNMMREIMIEKFHLPPGELPPKELCTIVAHLFPNKYSARRLRDEKWVDLVVRYGTEEARRAHQAHRVPNLDGHEAQTVSEPQNTMHSFSQLFCRTCYTYDCCVHGNTSRYSSRPKAGQPLDAAPTPVVPCGEHCFLKHDDFNQLSVSRTSSEPSTPTKCDPNQPLTVDTTLCLPSTRVSPRKHKQSPVKSATQSPIKSSPPSIIMKPVETERAKWKPAHVSMFHVLRSYFKDNYCWIADALARDARKTCLDVARLAMEMGPPYRNAFERMPTLQVSPKMMAKKKRDPYQEFRKRKWSKAKGKVTNQIPYFPCDHAGKCNAENCNCAKSGNECTKLCNCPGPQFCDNFFPGCRCVKGQCVTNQCPCFKALWECDPDICKACSKPDLDENFRCRNNEIQKGNAQELLLGVSDVAGWGCFVKNAVPKHTFISEYVGALITQAEAERRGKIYDAQKCSYLFNLNHDTSVDATKIGNKIRFANHSKHPNCNARLMRVKGDLRIGIYANKDLEAGEELFFDYSYNKHQQSSYVNIERMRLEKIKNEAKGMERSD